MVLSGICTVVSLATEDWLFAIFSGIALLASIAICGRVCVLRKRVQRGEAAEMKRRIKEVDDEEVKLEAGNKFRGIESEVAIMSVAYHVPRPLSF